METAFLILRVTVSLGVVLALILWAKRRVLRTASKNGRKVNAVNIIGRHGLASKASVVIVEAEGQRFVLGVTEMSVNVLHQVPVEAPTRPSFDQLMAATPDYDGNGFTDNGFTYDGATESVQGTNAVESTHDRLSGSILSPNTWKNAQAFSKGLFTKP